MFSRRCSFANGRKYSREFFERLVSDLRASGFTKISVLLPHNYVPVEQSVVSIEEILKRERNYSALILKAVSEERQETVKVLFVNKNSKAVFIDDTFPNAASEPPQLFFQSPDPGRTHSVFCFFRDYLRRPSLAGHNLLWILSTGAFFFLLAQFLCFVEKRDSFLHFRLNIHYAFDYLGVGIALYLAFKFFAEPRGLWIKPKRELRLLYLANMAIRGEFKDNPLVSVILAVVTTLLTTILLKWLKLL